MPELTRHDILRLLEALDERLRRNDVVGELYVVGGAVMCLVFRQRPSTNDIDGVFVPQEQVRAAARDVARELGVDEHWLNDAVKGFMSDRGAFSSFLDLPNLKVFTADPAYLLAMKCLALRLGPQSHDEADVRFLLRYLNIETVEQALAELAKFYPLDRFPPKTAYVLADLLPAHS